MTTFTKASLPAIVMISAISVAASAAGDPNEKAYGKRQPIVVLRGATMCVNRGDIVVLARSGSRMPSCRVLAKDTLAFQYGTPDQGIVSVGTPDADIWWTLQAAVKRH